MLLIIAFVFPLSARAEDTFPGKKNLGKLAMIVILSATAFFVKMLIDRERRDAARLREELGTPDRSIEFQEGFDCWIVEWYGENVYVFRNGVLYKHEPARDKKIRGGR